MNHEEAETPLRRQTDLLDSLLHSNAELSRTLNIKTEIIRVAAHDLRSPLSVVAGFVQLLKQDDLTPQERVLAFDSIDSALRKMQHIVDNILSLQRVEALAQQATERVDLSDIAAGVYHEFEMAAQDKRQQLSLSLPDGPVFVLADRVYLAEALTNLVGNALKYTPEGGQIEVRLGTDGENARFEVRDTGYGIPPDEMERLFQPFSRITTPETAAIDGTGLGLFLVKSAVERFGGRTEVESVYGQGSRFGFTLPLAGEPDAE